MSQQRWNGLSFLDALRPDLGWQIDRAILATYSADLVAVVAALLALAGLDDDRGSGSKVDFANAYEQLHGRTRILVQAGRLAAPTKRLPILAILDKFILEMNRDEQQGSWHPKIALLKFKPESPNSSNVEWRLWLGSRNLTRSLDWDTGLVLVGRPKANGDIIPGVTELGTDLARYARLADFGPEQVQRELEQIRWQSPNHTAVKWIRLFTTKNQRGLPSPPADLQKLVVISPFLDGSTVVQLGRWGSPQTHRTLLSTPMALGELARQKSRPLNHFDDLLCLDAPELDTIDAEEQRQTVSEDEEPEARGLHAKLIYAESSSGQATLWLGSANATSRGWNGPNVEVITELALQREAVVGITALTDLATIASKDMLAELAKIEPDESKLLEEARQQVTARWQVTQRHHAGQSRLVSLIPPHPSNETILLQVCLLTSDWVDWPRGQQEVKLPVVGPGQLTDLVQLRLTLGDHHLDWLLIAPLDPPADEERDRRALARYLDPRTFLEWIRSMLMAETLGDGGGEWHLPLKPKEVRQSSSDSMWLGPTLEEVLRAYSRDPRMLKIIDVRVDNYLKLMQAEVNSSLTDDERELLAKFQETWQVLRQVLVTDGV